MCDDYNPSAVDLKNLEKNFTKVYHKQIAALEMPEDFLVEAGMARLYMYRLCSVNNFFNKLIGDLLEKEPEKIS